MTENDPVVIATPPRLLITTFLVISASMVVLAVLLASHYGPEAEVFGVVVMPSELGRYGLEAPAISKLSRKVVIFRMPSQCVRLAGRTTIAAIELSRTTDGLSRYVRGDIVGAGTTDIGAGLAPETQPIPGGQRIGCVAVVAFPSGSRGQQQIEAAPTHSVVTVRIRSRAFRWRSFDAL
ncbi:hypothetical protein QHI69_20530 [Burkholderia gladioli pv. gladioli]|uniref:Uncharacterized protein n=1 Tax=Burkholderia gladioli TaxID=28095 RepID=A0AAW3ETT7_BURGA|nr:hypothetical protein [Burkholderia gladioli]ASD80005.1 hypothetical protein CEJ98_14125 [Burkholderia gladioli pv. gladioli]KGC11219.1 hypothetical protein DM48_7311 [Burkholderia gladioli]MDJ1164269.1 hypothetical protein [Burkholderia gladioli pv. gladioli]QPQ84112.1 hypothetical protein I6H08_03225 [Burkholderia gladioli]